MSKSVRFVSTSVALAYDSKHDRVIRVKSLIDDQGREWEEYDGGPAVLVEAPQEPTQKAPRTDSKK